MSDFETFTREKILRLRAEADALDKILKEFQATQARSAGTARRSGSDNPRSGAFGVVLEAILASGESGMDLDEMQKAGEAEGFEVKRTTLRSQVWKAKEDGVLVQMEPGRYRSAAYEAFAGVHVEPSSTTRDGAPGGGFQPAGRTQPSAPRESFSADLDDEIPF